MASHFPFGQKLVPVVQKDRSPKSVFVLGVYASAVHARWLDAQGRTLVRAMAVASEPEIFWKEQNASDIISGIKVPEGAGTLIPADPRLNGPSGRALDALFLEPLGYGRSSAWLCDLLPEPRMNPGQLKALERAYHPRMGKFGLPEPSIPPFSKGESDTDRRRQEILDELVSSEAGFLITLGDEPLRQFIGPLSRLRERTLRMFVEKAGAYGRPLPVDLAGHRVQLIALCHPRQAAGLGMSNMGWKAAHGNWIASKPLMA